MFKGAFHRVLLASTAAGGLVCGTLLGLSSASAGVQFSVRAVAVDCMGPCSGNTLGQICAQVGSGFVPIAVDCRDVFDRNSDFRTCAGGDRCSIFGVKPADPLSEYCDDTYGWDAHVYCAQ
jgi:hypothetical protein